MLRVLKLSKPASIFIGLCALLGATLGLAAVEDEIRARLQPAGEVCVMGTSCAASLTTTAATGPAGERDAQSIYQTYCTACHMTGVNNSPIYGDAEQWEPRLAKGRDVLFDSLLNGFNNMAMPAKGLCMDCSEDELHAVLDYLLEPVE